MNTYLKKFIDEKFTKPGKALDLGAGDFFDVACLKQLLWKCEGVDIKTGVDLEKIYESKNKPSDSNSTSNISHDYLKKMLTEQGFKNIKIKLFNYYDNEEGHKHWHKILEASGQKTA